MRWKIEAHGASWPLRDLAFGGRSTASCKAHGHSGSWKVSGLWWRHDDGGMRLGNARKSPTERALQASLAACLGPTRNKKELPARGGRDPKAASSFEGISCESECRTVPFRF